MKKLLRILPLFLVVIVLSSCGLKYRHEVESSKTPQNYRYGMGDFVRYSGYNNIAGDLETANATYKKKGSNITVKMVGVVHMGDKDYYQKLQKILDSADLVLYEGVRFGGKAGDVDPAAKAQWDILGEVLGLAGQLEAINYKRKHWKQCDLATNPKFMAKRQKKMLERINKAIKKARKNAKKQGRKMPPMRQMDPAQQRKQMARMIQQMDLQNQIRKFKGQLSPFVPMREVEDYLKHTYALQMSGMKNFTDSYKVYEGYFRQLEGLLRKARTFLPREMYYNLKKSLKTFKKFYLARLKEQMKFLIAERNEHVMKELVKQLGKIQTKKPYTVAIFYGAGHLKDFEERLKKIGYHRTSKKWFKAWKMDSR